MGGTTPKLAIPYVTAADLLSAYPVADKAQADRVEALMASRSSLDSAFLTAAAGWSVTSSTLAMYAKWGIWSAVISRTGANITVPADGNVATQIFATYDTVAHPLSATGPAASFDGRMASAQMFSNGNVAITAVAPGGGDIATGAVFNLNGLSFFN